MKTRKNNSVITILLFLVFILRANSFLFATPGGDEKKKSQTKTNTSVNNTYLLDFNKIILPINHEGILADVTINSRSGGLFNDKVFLFSGGFFMSGYSNGNLWTNGIASASRIQDYLPGTILSGKDDPRVKIYSLSIKDGEFSVSWNEWKDAVSLGAEFYDGDKNGIYEPIDLNNNGKWDTNEDRPDLIGDETVWCVYNDGVNPEFRNISDVLPQGIEIRQTIFGFYSKGTAGNVLFIRYQITNTGSVANIMDSVYFGTWADGDIGDPNDDMVGSDILLNAGFTYNHLDDVEYGNKPPVFLTDIIQGPVVYLPGVTFTDLNGNGIFDPGTDSPITNASSFRNPIIGKEILAGGMNLGQTAFVHFQEVTPDPPVTNKKLLRDKLLGLSSWGETINPCTWTLGEVRGGVDCNSINPLLWYSGDPVVDKGWINNTPIDQRTLSSTGPFKLEKGKPVTIVVAYIVGSGENSLNSITAAKNIDKIMQEYFDANFPKSSPPPPVKYSSETGKDFINLTWSTGENLKFQVVDSVLDIDKRVNGFYITQYLTKSQNNLYAGIQNSKIISRYDIKDSIKNIYGVAPNSPVTLIIPEAGPENKLDSALYSDLSAGRINFKIEKDFFTGEPLVKGREYYYSITQYTLNHGVIVNKDFGIYGPAGDYIDPNGNAIEFYESPLITVVMDNDMFNPAESELTGVKISGVSDGEVKYVAVKSEELTGNDYLVEFIKDNNQPAGEIYKPYWRLKNLTTQKILIDSNKIYNFDTLSFAGKLTEGFILKVKPVIPEIGEMEYSATDKWFKDQSIPFVGVYYPGSDLPHLSNKPLNSNLYSNVISADQLRRVEIRFNSNNPSKAYRYLFGYKTNQSYTYAGGITPSDTVGRGTPGNWNTTLDRANGYVNVPFTVWLVDPGFPQDNKQLNVGFIEKSKDRNGNPDGNWDPGTNLHFTSEYIVIFNSTYEENNTKIEYTGSNETGFANIVNGWSPITTALLNPEQRKIAASPWFNSLYVVGLERKDNNSFFNNGDTLVIPVKTYGYTEADKFTFTTNYKGELTQDEKKQLYDKIGVYPNPLFAYNPAVQYSGGNANESYVTFTNLPEFVNVKIFTLAGGLIRTLTQNDKLSADSPFLRWDLKNESNQNVGSGMYLATIDSPEFGTKVLKFAIIMPQK